MTYSDETYPYNLEHIVSHKTDTTERGWSRYPCVCGFLPLFRLYRMSRNWRNCTRSALFPVKNFISRSLNKLPNFKYTRDISDNWITKIKIPFEQNCHLELNFELNNNVYRYLFSTPNLTTDNAVHPLSVDSETTCTLRHDKTTRAIPGCSGLPGEREPIIIIVK